MQCSWDGQGTCGTCVGRKDSVRGFEGIGAEKVSVAFDRNVGVYCAWSSVILSVDIE